QAEDGIRDLIVTGVQTCALPIFRVPPGDTRRDRFFAGCEAGILGCGDESPVDGCVRRSDGLCRRSIARREENDHGGQRGRLPSRSEERRVGKEWRSRWAREQEKR